MVERILRPNEQAIINSREVLAEVPLAMQADIAPLARLSCALHTRTDRYGRPFTDEQIAILRKTQHFLLKRLAEQYPNQPIVNISDALAVMSQI